MDHYQIRVDSAGWINVGLALSYEVTDLAEGVHTVQVMAVDNRTNQATDSVGFEVSVALDLVIVAPSPLETFLSGEVQAEWQGWNNDSSISGYEVRVDSGPWVNVGMNTTYLMTGLAEGGHTFSVRVWDVAGNNATAQCHFSVDLTPPRWR